MKRKGLLLITENLLPGGYGRFPPHQNNASLTQSSSHRQRRTMDEHQAAVITAAIEQQQAQESNVRQDDSDGEIQGASAKQETKHRNRADDGAMAVAEEAHGAQRSTLTNGKGFAVDPALKVGVGIIRDISGPNTAPQDKPITEINDLGVGTSDCTRCKKEYAITDGKVYKLCPHCRELQRQRSRRWQQKTKLKEGACRRCGISIPHDQNKFVLCPPCRLNLRNRKSTRFDSGKCVHCSGVNDSPGFKVCARCRENDKKRREQLGLEGKCNRCSTEMAPEERKKKVCLSCRSRKKTVKAAVAAVGLASAAQEQETMGDLQNEITTEQQVELAQHLEANMFAQEQ